MSNPTPEITGSQKAYEEFLPAAEALAESEVRAYRADGSIALHNIEYGLDSITPHLSRIALELPTVDVAALKQLPNFALAVIYAAAQVDRSSDGSTQALLEKARALRALLVASAQALAVAGLLPAQEVERIRAGSGLIDLAQDNVDLAALFTKYAPALPEQSRNDDEEAHDASFFAEWYCFVLLGMGGSPLRLHKSSGSGSRDAECWLD